jgi:hypothetical protein
MVFLDRLVFRASVPTLPGVNKIMPQISTSWCPRIVFPKFLVVADPPMNISSVVVITLIGGAMLVVGHRTIKYNKARDRADQAYRTAVEILRNEFEDNIDLVGKMRMEIATGNFSKVRFRTKAWGVLLTKPLLAQMDEDASDDLRRGYDLIKEAETYRSQLIEALNREVGAAESVRREEYRTSLSCTLDDLATKLRRHLARVREETGVKGCACRRPLS